MTFHIVSKCGSSLHYGQACAFSDFQVDQMTCCIGHNRKPFLCCGLPCASSEFLIDQMTSGILNKRESCLHCWWGKDSPSHFAWAWTTQRRGDFQIERSETLLCPLQRLSPLLLFIVKGELSIEQLFLTFCVFVIYTICLKSVYQLNSAESISVSAF